MGDEVVKTVEEVEPMCFTTRYGGEWQPSRMHLDGEGRRWKSQRYEEIEEAICRPNDWSIMELLPKSLTKNTRWSSSDTSTDVQPTS